MKSSAMAATLIAISSLGIGIYPGLGLSAVRDASQTVSIRQKAMAEVRLRLKDINDMLKGRKAYSAKSVIAHAVAIQEHAFRMPELFPNDHYKGKTNALPAIWPNWSEFKSIARELDDQATELQFIARGELRQVNETFIKVAKTCVKCHDKFKKDK